MGNLGAELLYRRVPIILTLGALCFVGCVLSGWLFGLELLVRGSADRAAMVPSTAISVALLFSGAAFYLRPDRMRGAVITCAGLAAAVALTNSIVIPLDGTGLDVFVETRAPTDRMSPGTITGLLIAAFGLASLCSARLRGFEAPMLTAVAGLTGILSVIVVHDFDLGAPLALPFVEAMSIYTALSLLTFYVVLLLIALAPSHAPRVSMLSLGD